jgi:hypothetical protein
VGLQRDREEAGKWNAQLISDRLQSHSAGVSEQAMADGYCSPIV